MACYDTEYGKVGLAICFDIHEMPEKYKPHDIWALLYPIACKFIKKIFIFVDK